MGLAGQSAPLKQSPTFTLLWLGQGLSAGGDAFSVIAIPLLVLHETGSILQMGLLTGLTSVGSITAGGFAGIVVDRVDWRRLMILCDAVRAQCRIWWKSRTSTAANGRLEATYAVMTLVGMTAAGVVSAAFGPRTAIAVDAASFGLSMLCLVAIRFNAVDAAHADRSGVPSRGEFLAGIRFLRDTPILRALTVVLSLETFVTLGLTDVFIFHLKHDLRQSDRSVGYVLAVATIGAMLGGGLVSLIRRTLGFGRCWIGAYACCGLAIAGMGLTGNALSLAGLAAAFTFCTAIAGTCSMSVRQEVTPDQLLGRVTSAFWTVHNAVGPIGAGVLTAAVSHYSVRSVSLVAGIATVVIALSGSFTAVGSFGSAPRAIS